MTDEVVVCPDCDKPVEAECYYAKRPRSVAIQWMWLANVLATHRRLSHPE